MFTETFSFTHLHPSGEIVSVEVELEIEPKTCDNSHLAASDWDLQDEVGITFMEVKDAQGNVREDLDIDDELIMHEFEMEMHIREVMQGEAEFW